MADSPANFVPGRPLLLGHRGARNYAPENSLAAFALALKHGCDGFEFDVRCTSDAQAIICHDPKFHGAAVAESTYEQLAGDATDDVTAAMFLARSSSAVEGIPCLDEVVESFGARAWLDIELKVPGLERATFEILESNAPLRGVLVSSFLPEVLSAFAEVDSRTPLGLICENAQQLAAWISLPISTVLPHRKLVSRELIEEIRVAGKKVMAWTVNDEREMRRFAEWGVDGLISDDTELLGRLFNGQR